MIKNSILTFLFITTSLSINAQNWFGNSKKISGNGNVVTVKRTTSDYDAIAVGGSFDVILVKGKEGAISIEGEENIIPFIETEVNGNTLQVKFQKNSNISTSKRLTITITYMDLEKISLGGSGNVLVEGELRSKDFSVSLGGSGNITLKVNADEMNVNIGGSGNIKLEGKTDDLSCSIAGSGSIKAYDLSTESLNASIAGSGSIKITVTKEIKAKVVGSGSIYYKGNPSKVDAKSVGSGEVVDKN